MGKSLAKFLWRFTGPRYVRVLMLGLDGVGKTSILSIDFITPATNVVLEYA